MSYKRLINYLIAFMLLVFPAYVFAENIDPDNNGLQYAWGENIGWLNLEPSYGPGITVTNTAVTGYAWGENIGWINFSPATGGVANDGYGNLSGYAWGENVGWINFAPTVGGVWIDSNGYFNGYAWGENIGWINFVPASGGVKTSWRPDADNCSDAKQITVFDYTDSMDTTTATTAPDDPVVCAGNQGNTVWYTFTAPANGTVTVDTIGSNYDTVLAAYTGTCGNFIPVSCDDDGGGNLTSLITFNVTAGTTYYFMAAGYYNPGGGQLTFSLLYTGPIADLVTWYYNSILNRAPEPGGAEGWTGEIQRINTLGIDIKEGFIALGKLFFNSTEYLNMNTANNEYVIDLYETFLGRTPTQGEVDAWAGELAGGLTRNLLLNYFIFSAEFMQYMTDYFGDTTVRPEYNLVNDLYRGFLSRLPDDAGFNYWLTQMQTAQCNGDPQAIRDLTSQIALLFLNSQEYADRNTSNSEYIEDLYNGILRRGAELSGYLYWLGELDGGAYTRAEMLQLFVDSTEFQTRVQQVIDAGCAY